MYLFSRSGRLANGNSRETALWLASITEKVNQITDLQVGLWRNVFSPEFGRITWAAFVEDLAQLEAADDKLNADDAFVAEVDRGAAFTSGGLDDALAQVVYGEPDPERPIEYVSVVSTLIVPGAFARGTLLAVEIAQVAEKATGIPTMVASSVTGDYSAIEWIAGYENVQALQAAGEKINQDADFVQLLDKEVPGAYESGVSVTNQVIYRRVI
jgi:hypothetical protein